MPDEDAGDVFLRHRGAVLEALLSDPSFGPSAAPPSDSPDFGTASLGLPDLDPDSEPVAPRRRGGDGPRASERILALLNGQTQDTTSAMDFASDYSAAAARSNTPEPEPEPERPAATQSNRLAPAQQVAKDALVQLRKPRVALIVAAVVAVLLVLLLVTTGGGDSKNTAQNQLLVVTPPPTSAAPTTSAAPAAGSIIQVKSAESKCPPGSTSAMDAFSGQSGKAWSCVRAYKVDGQVITIDLGKTYQIDSIGIVPGWDNISADGIDQWSKYRTVSRVSYQFDDGNKTVYTQPTLDQRTLVVTKIEPTVSASKIVLTVLESKGGPSINTTAISSIVVTGR
ncbi:discoidin domain-containing protein [Nocardia pneumoniae]|uniref:discoidin domain-containing protein n=1 Tax=Nocardia pneumoniae TaxID=228601 RepID=UPI0002E09884|nr:discoidin domain-containing protein [Nocardia pneumoniae]